LEQGAGSIILYAMQVLAILSAYNEERFIGGCLEHLFAIASRYLGAGLRGIEEIPRDGSYRWRQILRRKEALAAELAADWFLHLDADEVPLPPRSGQTLAEGLAEADAGGCNAVEFAELTFVPTREAPDHDHRTTAAPCAATTRSLPPNCISCAPGSGRPIPSISPAPEGMWPAFPAFACGRSPSGCAIISSSAVSMRCVNMW
jgi:hypothetical protein